MDYTNVYEVLAFLKYEYEHNYYYSKALEFAKNCGLLKVEDTGDIEFVADYISHLPQEDGKKIVGIIDYFDTL